MPRDAADLLGDDARVVDGVGGALARHVRDAYLAVALDVHEAVLVTHVLPAGGDGRTRGRVRAREGRTGRWAAAVVANDANAPEERRELSELLLQGLGGVPAVQKHLLQVDDVAPEIERVAQARGVARLERLARQRRREHRRQVARHQAEIALLVAQDGLGRGVEHAVARHARLARGARVRLPRGRVALERPRFRGYRRIRHRATSGRARRL